VAGESILVVEDEPAVARGLVYALKSEGFQPVWADTGQRALDLARADAVRLILLDVRLPDISGFDVCRQLRAEGRRQPIIMLTARDEEVDRILGLELGADDYVVKPYSVREVITRVRAQLRRAYGELSGAALGGKTVFGDVEIDWDRMQATRRGQPVNLTPTEFRLLKHLVGNADRAVSREALIEAVWGYAGTVEDDRTIDVHVRHLREKLEDDPGAPRWLATVRGVGYRFVANP
jgi:DNA-binding response OmpR family regulator